MSIHKHSVSVTIIAMNEADRIRPALESIKGWVDQIVVFDSGSSDNTVEICREYGAEVFVTEDWPGDGPQKQRALEKATSEWVLRIDADERVTPELRAEIEAILNREHIAEVGFKLPWSTYYFGRYVNRGGNGEANLSFFKRAGAQYANTRVHGGLTVAKGKVGRLAGRLQHESYRSFDHVLQKHMDYSLIWAEDRIERGKKSSITAACLHALSRFLQEYVVKLGFLDGGRGLLKSTISAQYTFNKYAALWAKSQPALDPRQSNESH